MIGTPRLFLIADDFTGALDTGIRFSEYGCSVRVITDPGAEAGPVQVLVLDAETRHLSPDRAYETVFRAVRAAADAGFTHIYKKTDSALRGNIGRELEAAAKASGQDSIAFLPALPAMGRVTRNGIHYIGEIPVAESVFGKDPFEPVRRSSVAEIIAEQSDFPVIRHGAGNLQETEQTEATDFRLPGIHLFDAETEEDLEASADALGETGLRVTAGCAGFAAVLVRRLFPDAGKKRFFSGTPESRLSLLPGLPPRLFVLCGSVNPVTVRQLAAAEKAGIPRRTLSLKEKLDPLWPDSPACRTETARWLKLLSEKGALLLDANDLPGGGDSMALAASRGMDADAFRVQVTSQLSRLAKALLEQGMEAVLLVTGGDTLLAFLKALGAPDLTPLFEPDPGVVLASFSCQGRTQYVLTKSGGFGDEELILRLSEAVTGQPGKET